MFASAPRQALLPRDVGHRCCPAGGDCEVGLQATLEWQETTVNRKGQTETKHDSQEWFDILLPAELGHAVVSELDIKPVEKKKK